MKQSVHISYVIVPGLHLKAFGSFYGNLEYNRTMLPSIIMPTEVKQSSDIIKGQWVINRLYDAAKLLCLDEYLNGVSYETLMPIEEYVKAHYELVKDRIYELNVLIDSLDNNFKKLDSRIEKLMVMDKVDSASSELDKISNYHADAMKQYYEDQDALQNMKGAICFLKVYLSKLVRECPSVEFICRRSSEGSKDPYADGNMFSVMRNLELRYKPSVDDSSRIFSFECVSSGGSLLTNVVKNEFLRVVNVAAGESVCDGGSSPGAVSVAAEDSVFDEVVSPSAVSLSVENGVFDEVVSPGAVSLSAEDHMIDYCEPIGAEGLNDVLSGSCEAGICEDGEGLVRSCNEPEQDSNAVDVFENIKYSMQNNVSLISAVCNVSVLLKIGEICWRLFYEWVLSNSVLVECASVNEWDAGPPDSRVLTVLLAS